tara:strand:+ start:43 stop:513 length:471 start_codon:yes stop_codon:yes gene_type:complete
MKPIGVSYESIREQFKYDKVNGGVVRVKGKKGGATTLSYGYLVIRVTIDSVSFLYKEHRLVYLLHNPDMDQSLTIDHINGIKTDNRIENLRLVTDQENSFNRPTAKGFNWLVGSQKFRSRLTVGGKEKSLGCYDNILDARAAYLRAKKKYHIIEER